jgi:hypothetical protein
MAKDPTNMQGPRTIKEGIAHDTGEHISRYVDFPCPYSAIDTSFSDWITNEMHELDPDGFAARAPTAKKIHRVPIVALGIHDRWCADGHDKLKKIGFPIWAVREMWSGKWLGLWSIPDNRLKLAIAYLYLRLVEEHGGNDSDCFIICDSLLILSVGMPLLMVTDCGSETTKIYGFANALRRESYYLRNTLSPANCHLERLSHLTCLCWNYLPTNS